MENHKKIRIALAVGIIFLAFALLNLGNLSLTGFAVSENLNISSASRQDAVLAINESLGIIENLRNDKFAVSYFEDTLSNAKKTLEIADYAAILKNSSLSDKQKQEALAAVKLSDWKNTDYNSVIAITDSIKARAQETYKISDRIFAGRLRINMSQESGVDVYESELKLNSAANSFRNERYAEADKFIAEFQNSLEKAIAEHAKNISLQQASLNFFRRYWQYISIFILAAFALSAFVYKKLKVFNIHRKIYHLRAEKQALHNLIIISQRERYNENKISGLVYNVRIKKYQERLNQIEEEIPVLEAKLQKKKRKNR